MWVDRNPRKICTLTWLIFEVLSFGKSFCPLYILVGAELYLIPFLLHQRKQLMGKTKQKQSLLTIAPIKINRFEWPEERSIS